MNFTPAASFIAGILLTASASFAEPPRDELDQRIRALQSEIDQLRERFGRDHPHDQPAEPTREEPAEVGILEPPVERPGPLEGWPWMGYDGGFFVRSADDNFALRLRGRLQPRFEYTNRGRDENATSFYMRRIRIDLTGHAFTDRLTFRIMPELARDANLRDGFVNYAFQPTLQLRGGQFTVPFQWHRFISGSRQHFTERSLTSETLGFRNGYDIGIMLHGQNKARTWHYGLGIFDGSGRNTRISNSEGVMASGRFTYAILGQVPRDETDYARSEAHNLSIGAGLQTANKSEIRNWDLGRSTAGNRRADWITGTADINYRWQGFSIAAAGYLREVDPDDALVDSYTGGGYMVSAGYAIIPELLEGVARYDWLRLDLDEPDTRIEEWGIGLNIYHRGHDWKTRINYLHQTGFGQDGRLGRFIVEHHLQF